jgi:glutathione S-transferase
VRAGRPLRLHWSPDSANLPVRIVLEAFALPYEAVRVDRAAGAQRGPAFRALNPQGLIPVLEEDGRPLFETGAILLHLADRVGRYGPRGPGIRAPGVRGAVLKWLFFLSNTVHAEFRIGIHPERFAPEEAAGALRAGVGRRLDAHLDTIEAALPASGGLAAPAPGIVEVYLACIIRWARLYPGAAPLLPGGGAARPRLAALLAALEGWPAVARAAEAEAIPARAPFTAPAPPDLPAAMVTG